MCKAEELWKQIDAYRRRKMIQDEIDSALMEYITYLEKHCDDLLKDANRYRWLRDESPHYKSPATQGTEVDGFGIKVVFQLSGTDARSLPLRFLSGAVLDALVDSSMLQTKD